MASANLPETKHTPGPWRSIGRTGVVMRSGPPSETGSVHICQVGAWDDGELVPFNGDRWLADAALIARAPDLLAENERLREALHWLVAFADVRSKDDSKTFARVNRGALRTIRDRATAALSEQEGSK